MPLRQLSRRWVAAVVSLGLALPLVGSLQGSEQVHADQSHLVLSEINWAGSAQNPADQWVELYNPGSSTVILSQTPYTLMQGNTVLATVNTGFVPMHGYYLVARAAQPSTLLVNPDMVAPDLHLGATGQYKLEDASGMVVDVAGTDQNPDLAGQDGQVGSMPIASMSRRSSLQNGDMASSWFTPQTIGTGFKSNVVQYGTPANSGSAVNLATINPEIGALSHLSFAPQSAATPDRLIISGVADTSTSNRVMSSLEKINGSTASATQMLNADGSFSFDFGTQLAGAYRAFVTAYDIYGNRTGAVQLPVAGSQQGVYVINPPTVPAIAAPGLYPYPDLVTTDTITLTGTVQAGATIVFSVNGKDVAAESMAAQQTNFSLLIQLLKNQINRIEVRAQDSNGTTSAPAIATVTQDSLAPMAVNATLVKATPTSIQGAAGSAEPNSTIAVYGDSTLTQYLGLAAVYADGSFGPMYINPAKQAGTLYLLPIDQAGNKGAVSSVSNPLSVAGQTVTLNGSAATVGNDRVTISWPAIPGAVSYLIKYKAEGGTYTVPMKVASPTTSIINLKPGTKYVIAVAAVDQNGGITPYSETTVQTLGAVKVASATVPVTTQVTTPSGSTGSSSSSSASTATVTPTPVPTATASPTPSPSASPSSDTGEVKSATTSRNWTPWIILAILIGLAAIATAAYFYWFGGEEPVAATAGNDVVTTVTTKENRDSVPPVEKTTAPPVEPPAKDKKPNGEKRW